MMILLMYLCTLRAMAELTTTSPGELRWFYKGVQFPWVLPEDQLGCFQLHCRDTHYDWENYFDQLMDAGVKNFVLGGNYIVDSEIRRGPPFFPPWSETGFAALRKRVDAKGGKIYADLDLYEDVVFDKALFVKSINNFTKHFPVHGFLLSYPDYRGNYTVKEALETIKELNFGCGFGFPLHGWDRVVADGAIGIADIHFIRLQPYLVEDVPEFNTNKFVDKIIAKATAAGVNPNTVLLRIPTTANSSPDNDASYASAILVFHGDPKGKGAVSISGGRQLYFFSQPRAVEKIKYVKEHGLYGLMLDPRSIGGADLNVSDSRSLFYAITTANL